MSDYTIPTALDWFSVDIYHMDGYVSGWVNAHVRAFYETYIFPNISSVQRAILVPGSHTAHDALMDEVQPSRTFSHLLAPSHTMPS